MGTTTNDELAERWALGRSRYEGPTGVVGALNDALGKSGLRVASLWAAPSCRIRTLSRSESQRR